MLSVIFAGGVAALVFGASMASAPEIAAAFLISMLGNIAVRDDGDCAKLVTLGLSAVTITLAISVSGALSEHPLAVGLLVFATCIGAATAQSSGPRGMAIGMIAFMGSFMGSLLHARLQALPQIFAAAMLGAATVSLFRLVLMRDNYPALLDRVRRDLDRGVARLVLVARDLAARERTDDDGNLPEQAQARIHRELARLNDAFLIAQDELNEIDTPPSGTERLSWDSFFALELAAERLIRAAARHGAGQDHKAAARKLNRLHEALVAGAPLPTPECPAPEDPLLRSIDRLIAVVARRGAGDQQHQPVVG